jgi:hypothetical protein
MATYKIRNYFNTCDIGTITREDPPPLGLLVLDARNNRYYSLASVDRHTTPYTYFASACQSPGHVQTLD